MPGWKLPGGGYIAFLDNDDYVDSDYIQTLYQNVDGMDAVACGSREVSGGVEVSVSIPEDKSYLTNQQIKEAYKNRENLFAYYRAALTKLYRNSVIGDLRFIKTVGEDIIFNIQFLQKASKVRTISYCGYNYWSNPQSITRQKALQYCETREDEYWLYRKIKVAAMKDWGFSDEALLDEENKAKAKRYFSLVSNLVLPGTPYSEKEIRDKIREIHSDKEYMQIILAQKYKDLHLMGKIAKLSVQLNTPWFTEFMFYCITRAQIMAGKSARLSRGINKIRKRV